EAGALRQRAGAFTTFPARAALGTRATLAPGIALTAELAEEALQRMIPRHVLKSGHAEGEAAATVGSRFHLGLDAYADDRRGNLLDDVGKACGLHAFDADGLGQHRHSACRHRAKADGSGNGDGGSRGEKPVARARMSVVLHISGVL